MLITVIIPNYNYEKYIGETLQSLIAQSYQNWECIVVDDGSQDGSRAEVRKYVEVDNRIKYLYQPNGGQASARNRGLKYARGNYIQFLDADDLLEPLKIECHLQFLEAHPEIDLVYGETRYFRNEFPTERRYSLWTDNLPWMPKVSGRGTELIEKLIESNIFTVSSPLIRKAVIDSVGEFDTTLNPIEDWEYWMRCAIANVSMHYLDVEGTMDLIRIHAFSATQNLRRGAYKRLLMRRKFSRILPDHRLRAANAEHLKKTEEMWIGTESFDGVAHLKKGQILQGARKIYQAIRLNPVVARQILIRRLSKLGVRRDDTTNN